MFRTLVLAAGLSLLAACAGSPAPVGTAPAPRMDADRLLGLVEALSADAMMGRGAGTPGGAAARALLIGEMQRIGLEPVGGAFAHPFTYGEMDDQGPQKAGVNLIGRVPGTGDTGRALVVTAHYDHLGVIDGEIYNGADDNASGVAVALEIGRVFTVNAPRNDVWIILFDAEEDGFGGAIDFIQDPPLAREEIALNLNLDMVSKSAAGELYAAGTYHSPQLVAFVEDMAARAPVSLLMGHDRPEDGDQDWTLQSDHAVFHRAGIPFLYLGVEDHPEYHRPTDDFETIPADFFVAAAETAVMIAEALDERLDALAPPAGGRPGAGTE